MCVCVCECVGEVGVGTRFNLKRPAERRLALPVCGHKIHYTNGV